jgi:hypothetical protein
MQRPWLLLPIVLASWIGLLTAGPSYAAGSDLTTPEGAVAAYIDGVIRQDFSAIIAATSVDNMSKGFDFVAQVDRTRSLSPFVPAPASASLFVDINKANFTAEIARQVQFLAYGLMTTSEILDGKTIPMDAAKAAEFASVARADRLASLALVKVGIPKPASMNSKVYQLYAVKIAKVYGADASTERVAVVSFEGLNFLIGFSLLRYGEHWTIRSASSPIAGTDSLGAPKRMTLEEFEEMLR